MKLWLQRSHDFHSIQCHKKNVKLPQQQAPKYYKPFVDSLEFNRGMCIVYFGKLINLIILWFRYVRNGIYSLNLTGKHFAVNLLSLKQKKTHRNMLGKILFVLLLLFVDKSCLIDYQCNIQYQPGKHKIYYT